jgi:hypothetical protein
MPTSGTMPEPRRFPPPWVRPGHEAGPTNAFRPRHLRPHAAALDLRLRQAKDSEAPAVPCC